MFRLDSDLRVETEYGWYCVVSTKVAVTMHAYALFCIITLLIQK